MKLTRTVHLGGFQVFYEPVAQLIPDVQLVGADDSPDQCLMFVSAAGGEAHGFLFTKDAARELAERILAPTIETFQTFPGGMLGPHPADVNGDTP